MKKSKKLAKEEKALLEQVVMPALNELKSAAKDWVPPAFPEYEGDPLDLTPEQEAEICRQIRRSRGHGD